MVATLLYLLCVAIDRGFNGHLKSTEQILVKVSSSLAAVPSSAAPSMVPSAATLADMAEPQLSAEKSKVKSEGTLTNQPAASAPSAEASLHELLSTGVKAIASTTVAVIWVLVIAIAVITISIARAVLLLKPQGLESSVDGDGRSDGGAANALPGLEFAKEVIKLVTDTAQSIRK